MILGSIFSHLGTRFGTYFGTRLDQEEPGPKGQSTDSTYRKPAFAKTFENQWFFKVFGGSNAFQDSSEDPRNLPRGYLGLLGAVLSHLGAIL